MPDGLSTVEVKERRRQFERNKIPTLRYQFFTILARQFKGIFNVPLILAAGFTYALREAIDASFILHFVFLSVDPSLFKEYKSNAAAEKLKSYLVKTITVRRDGADTEIGDLVPGDILKLEPGEIVPADAVILHTTGLQVDETVFTGESVPVIKTESKGGIAADNGFVGDVLAGFTSLIGPKGNKGEKVIQGNKVQLVKQALRVIQEIRVRCARL